ncbi:MAG: CopG family transcriptional regulator [Deltaproteobacteria bacterium]|nr:CopG family transcriptional regulator [Deltaproteobacteria bacterium]
MPKLRTQIQFTEEQARHLRIVSRREGLSVAELVRRYVDTGLAAESPERNELYARALALLGRFSDREGARDVAVEHDRYLDDAWQ